MADGYFWNTHRKIGNTTVVLSECLKIPHHAGDYPGMWKCKCEFHLREGWKTRLTDRTKLNLRNRRKAMQSYCLGGLFQLRNSV
jgi:hypothetical protein